MKVHLIKKQSIEQFVLKNVQAHSAFNTWIQLIKVADWVQPSDMIQSFSFADILGRNSQRIIFNIGGNKYRLICSYHFGEKQVHLFVKWIGTHANYTKLCNKGLQFTVNEY